MEPMKPMKPMAPMKPMEPMAPMKGGEAWWPQELGEPSSSGGQDGLRYAFFPEASRLLVERDGRRSTYDTGSRRINGVQQASGRDVEFSCDEGAVRLGELRQV